MDELQQQYQAQADVIGQLEDRVRRLLAGAGQRTAADKLRRDFERVQARATALQSGVARLREEQAKLRKNQQQFEKHSAELGVSPTPTLDHYQQVQLQLQQDVSGAREKWTHPRVVSTAGSHRLTQRLHEEIMREREEEIRNINRGMHQVNEIYKDLAHIVGTQQEQIDSIETQMEDSRANAESGLKQVEKANEKFGNSQCVIS